MVEADTVAADARAAKARTEHGVWPTRPDSRPDSVPVADTAGLFVRGHVAGIHRFAGTVEQVAALLAEQITDETMGQLRARAVGILADPLGAVRLRRTRSGGYGCEACPGVPLARWGMRVAPTSVPLRQSGLGAPRDPFTLAFGGHRAPPRPEAPSPGGGDLRWATKCPANRPGGGPSILHPESSASLPTPTGPGRPRIADIKPAAGETPRSRRFTDSAGTHVVEDESGRERVVEIYRADVVLAS